MPPRWPASINGWMTPPDGELRRARRLGIIAAGIYGKWNDRFEHRLARLERKAAFTVPSALDSQLDAVLSQYRFVICTDSRTHVYRPRVAQVHSFVVARLASRTQLGHKTCCLESETCGNRENQQDLVGERGFEPPPPWSRTSNKRIVNNLHQALPSALYHYLVSLARGGVALDSAT